MSRVINNLLAGLMLIFMLGLAFFSMRDDSAIMDELAHLPAGYSYITQADMRLNPEHPPLIKDLAGASVWLWSKISAQPINFPSQIPAWQNDINGQWDFGGNFLYKQGNSTEPIIFWGRFPTLLILLILGIYIFKWATELFGGAAGLLALFLYSFSPTFLAHGRFVTTDVAAAAAIFIASYYFIRWLKTPTKKNLIIAGLIFGLAQLAKFSVFMLIPLFGFIALVWIYLQTKNAPVDGQTLGKNIWRYLGGTILLMTIGYIFVVWPVYLWHTANYPIERQIRDTQFILGSFSPAFIPKFIEWLAGIPVLRALAQYGLGLAMVLQRASGGNTTYFLGEVSAAGSQLYFPFVYLVKETITLHIFTIIALILAFIAFFKKKIYQCKNLRQFLTDHMAEFLMLCFIAMYWASSIKSPLNIGVRHILPTFPFIFLLVASQIKQWLQTKNTHHNILKCFFIGLLLAWQAGSIASVYPSFLAYFNESIGGPKNGYQYAVDSNLDWGQDLKRLADWTEKNNVQKIYLDYFGGGSAEYYLGGKLLPWYGSRRPEDLNVNGGWLAVSATLLQCGRGKPAPGFKDATDYYNWLNKFQPITTIGYSIFVYYIPPHSFDKISFAEK